MVLRSFVLFVLHHEGVDSVTGQWTKIGDISPHIKLLSRCCVYYNMVICDALQITKIQINKILKKKNTPEKSDRWSVTKSPNCLWDGNDGMKAFNNVVVSFVNYFFYFSEVNQKKN